MPTKGVQAKKDLIDAFHKSGNNFELLNKKLGLDPDMLFNMLGNSLQRRNPTRNKADLEELTRALKEQKTYNEGRETIKSYKSTQVDEGIVRWYKLELGKKLPSETNRATSFGVRVKGKYTGRRHGHGEYIQSMAAGSLEEAMMAIARVVKDYMGDFEADDDGFELKTFEYTGPE